MEEYKCKICNKNHTVYYGLKAGIPRHVLEMRMNQEEERIKEFSDYLIIIDKKKVLLKGQIILETLFTESLIVYQAWIEIPKKIYVAQIEKAKEKPSLELVGELASELPFYQQLKGAKAKWILNKGDKIGEIRALSDCQLRSDQKEPISKERLIKMMNGLHHPELE